MTRPRWRGYLLVVIAVSCFGAAGALAKFLFLNGVTPEQLVQLRLLTASLGLWAVVALTSIGARGQAGEWRGSALSMLEPRGLLFGGSLLLVMYTYYLAVSRIGVAPAILLQYTHPVLVVLYAALALREHTPRFAPLAMVLAFAGCALVVRAYDPAQLRIDAAGIAAGLLSSVCAAIYLLAGRSVQRRFGTLRAMAFGFTLATVLSVLVGGPGIDLAPPDRPDLLAGGVAVGLVGTLVPFVLIVRSTRYILPAETAIVSGLEVVVGGAIAAAWLGEALGPLQLLGGAFVLSGVTALAFDERLRPRPGQESAEAGTSFV